MSTLQESLKFLLELKENNNREWMEANKKRYQSVRAGFEGMIADLIQKIGAFDADIAGLQVKECVFRINRDVRFSNDKSPYKITFSAYIGKGGKKAEKAGYYLQISPAGSFLAGGRFMPASEDLKKIRQEIDYNADAFLQLIQAPDFKKYFGTLSGEALARAPKGYPLDHPLVDYLKKKSFLMEYPITKTPDSFEALSQEAAQVFKAMKPLNDFLNAAVEWVED
ncbi:DUF2461 domain-containing protein [Cytophagales bacterium LB-30]|uniref:DUF2461 domain-containing protein n=1 Tax=Shiella aurantiaca TaxID=3058365 RepID=A0ABT8F6T0_9BACT|nr:DUF2461 domain-containing protein [Shiella aurantiaca]MDN4166197.1 DUF2461 domain-containing protein [Shiella aurantiaca]